MYSGGNQQKVLLGRWVLVDPDILFLDDPTRGIKVIDGVLAVTFTYPPCTDLAVEIGNKMLRDPSFVPEKRYEVASKMVTPANAQQLYDGK